MEIPVINRLNDFEVGINSLPDPSLISKLFALSGIEKFNQASDYWKWSALILALIASFTTIIITRFHILAVRLKRLRSVPLPTLVEEDNDFGTSSESDTSDYSSSDDEQERNSLSTSQDWRRIDENFQVRGSAHVIRDRGQNSHFTLRRRRASFVDLFSLSDLVAGGKSVVKLWDNLGLGFGLYFDDGEDSDGFNVFDINEERKIALFEYNKCGAQAVSKPSSPRQFSCPLAPIYRARRSERVGHAHSELEAVDFGGVVAEYSGGENHGGQWQRR